MPENSFPQIELCCIISTKNRRCLDTERPNTRIAELSVQGCLDIIIISEDLLYQGYGSEIILSAVVFFIFFRPIFQIDPVLYLLYYNKA